MNSLGIIDDILRIGVPLSSLNEEEVGKRILSDDNYGFSILKLALKPENIKIINPYISGVISGITKNIKTGNTIKIINCIIFIMRKYLENKVFYVGNGNHILYDILEIFSDNKTLNYVFLTTFLKVGKIYNLDFKTEKYRIDVSKTIYDIFSDILDPDLKNIYDSPIKELYEELSDYHIIMDYKLFKINLLEMEKENKLEEFFKTLVLYDCKNIISHIDINYKFIFEHPLIKYSVEYYSYDIFKYLVDKRIKLTYITVEKLCRNFSIAGNNKILEEFKNMLVLSVKRGIKFSKRQFNYLIRDKEFYKTLLELYQVPSWTKLCNNSENLLDFDIEDTDENYKEIKDLATYFEYTNTNIKDICRKLGEIAKYTDIEKKESKYVVDPSEEKNISFGPSQYSINKKSEAIERLVQARDNYYKGGSEEEMKKWEEELTKWTKVIEEIPSPITPNNFMDELISDSFPTEKYYAVLNKTTRNNLADKFALLGKKIFKDKIDDMNSNDVLSNFIELNCKNLMLNCFRLYGYDFDISECEKVEIIKIILSEFTNNKNAGKFFDSNLKFIDLKSFIEELQDFKESIGVEDFDSIFYRMLNTLVKNGNYKNCINIANILTGNLDDTVKEPYDYKSKNEIVKRNLILTNCRNVKFDNQTKNKYGQIKYNGNGINRSKVDIYDVNKRLIIMKDSVKKLEENKDNIYNIVSVMEEYLSNYIKIITENAEYGTKIQDLSNYLQALLAGNPPLSPDEYYKIKKQIELEDEKYNKIYNNYIITYSGEILKNKIKSYEQVMKNFDEICGNLQKTFNELYNIQEYKNINDINNTINGDDVINTIEGKFEKVDINNIGSVITNIVNEINNKNLIQNLKDIIKNQNALIKRLRNVEIPKIHKDYENKILKLENQEKIESEKYKRVYGNLLDKKKEITDNFDKDIKKEEDKYKNEISKVRKNYEEEVKKNITLKEKEKLKIKFLNEVEEKRNEYEKAIIKIKLNHENGLTELMYQN